MPRIVVIAFVATALSGCTLGTTDIRRGAPITHIQLNFGVPDVISDSSGDETRFYTPQSRPEYEWPAEAPRAFYYLDHNLQVTFVLGKAVEASAIDKDVADVVRQTLGMPSLQLKDDVRLVEFYLPFFRRRTIQDDDGAIRRSLPYDSIAIERTPCMGGIGSCPVYQMVLHRDGKAELDARAHLTQKGRFVGQVDLRTLGQLCCLIESSHFDELEPHYESTLTDAPSIHVTVTRGTTRTTVSVYGPAGPATLWDVHAALQRVKDEIEWKPAQDSR